MRNENHWQNCRSMQNGMLVALVPKMRAFNSTIKYEQ